MSMIYYGKKANSILDSILYENISIKAKGYYKESQSWIAFDNTRRECFIEEFLKEAEAVAWVNGYAEVSEIKEIRLTKLFNGVFYFEGIGFVKTIIRNEIMSLRLIGFQIT